MFGTVFRVKPRAGQEQAVIELSRQWNQEHRPQVDGFVAQYVFKSRTRPGELVGVAIFDSEASYRKNADDPEQDRWYQRLRQLLEADPEWNDGDVVLAA